MDASSILSALMAAVALAGSTATFLALRPGIRKTQAETAKATADVQVALATAQEKQVEAERKQFEYLKDRIDYMSREVERLNTAYDHLLKENQRLQHELHESEKRYARLLLKFDRLTGGTDPENLA